MARRRAWSEKTIEQLESEGRGRGTGSSYKPWLRVADVSSLGRSRRVWSHKTGRQHELLSDVEYNLFLCFEWATDVVDIREQYPLDRAMTQEIASVLGIPHPHYPQTHVPTVMTVDFLVTRIRNGGQVLEAYDAKRDEEAEDERSMAKLEIPRSYFESLEVPHHLVFHSAIPERITRNIAWIRDAALQPDEREPYSGYYASLMSRMSAEIAASRNSLALRDHCELFDQRHGTETGTGLRVVRMLLQRRSLMVDMDLADIAAAPLTAFAVVGTKGQLRVLGDS